MSRTYNDYHFEKLDILDTLDKIEMSVRFLYLWVQEPMGLENAKYVLEKNANRKFDWFDIHMVRDIANEELN
tara:strand:+ start:1071 stop:1286 length:216 start_codon:yes stop_codon:yes gene_type:complete